MGGGGGDVPHRANPHREHGRRRREDPSYYEWDGGMEGGGGVVEVRWKLWWRKEVAVYIAFRALAG